jgi:MFS transporter, DHA2 family, multidrug resistance protein
MSNSQTSDAGSGSAWHVAIIVAIAAFMEVLDTTIANVALPYIAGNMGVSVDEASWVVTTYLVSNAISLTASPFLSGMLGRKRFFIICLAIFTASSILCGFAWNLDSLLVFRILQGLGGGGMVPVSQSILADSFAPEKRAQGFALFGLAVVVAPVLGPTLGGYLSDNFSWHWCFLINAPIGIAAMLAIQAILKENKAATDERRRQLEARGGFDIVGFILVATFLSALEVVLDRGLEDDWFGSTFIVTMTTICAAAFVLMIPWELKRENPIIDVRMIASRQFGACFLVMLATGAILLSTTNVLPQLVQQNFGYTATWAGLVLSPGGVVTMIVTFIVGRISGWTQPRFLIIAGSICAALSMYDLSNVYQNVDYWFFATSRILLGIGLPMLFLSITSASYDGIPPNKTDQASAMMNAARNVGGSIGVSLAANVLAHREQFHQTRLSEHVIPSSQQYHATLNQVVQAFVSQGSTLAQAQQQAIAWIGQTIQAQTALLAYIDVFWTLMWVSLSAIPLALMMRSVKRKRASS